MSRAFFTASAGGPGCGVDDHSAGHHLTTPGFPEDEPVTGSHRQANKGARSRRTRPSSRFIVAVWAPLPRWMWNAPLVERSSTYRAAATNVVNRERPMAGQAQRVPRGASYRSSPVSFRASRRPGWLTRSLALVASMPESAPACGLAAIEIVSDLNRPSVRVPVTTVPAPRPRSCDRSRAGAGPAMVYVGHTRRQPSRSGSIPLPVVAETATIGEPSSVVPMSSFLDLEGDDRGDRGVDPVDLGQGHHPETTPSRSRTARCSSDCGIQPSSAATTNRATSIASIPASMFLMNRSCPGTSTNETSPAGEGRPGKAEVDGEPTSLLLGPAVGVTPGQRVDQGRLAVVDMAGGPDQRQPATMSAITSSSSSATALRSRTRSLSIRRVRTGSWRREDGHGDGPHPRGRSAVSGCPLRGGCLPQ